MAAVALLQRGSITRLYNAFVRSRADELGCDCNSRRGLLRMQLVTTPRLGGNEAGGCSKLRQLMDVASVLLRDQLRRR